MPGDFDNLPHHYEITYLGRAGVDLLARRVIEALGFEHTVEGETRGQSGLTHPPVHLGFKKSDKHVLLLQSGFERAFSGEPFPKPRRRPGDPSPPTAHDRRDLPEREE